MNDGVDRNRGSDNLRRFIRDAPKRIGKHPLCKGGVYETPKGPYCWKCDKHIEIWKVVAG